jgi:hypothetical protein
LALPSAIRADTTHLTSQKVDLDQPLGELFAKYPGIVGL